LNHLPKTDHVMIHLKIEWQHFDIHNDGPTHDQKVALKAILMCLRNGYDPKQWNVGIVQGGRTLMFAEKNMSDRHTTSFLVSLIVDAITPNTDLGDDYPEAEDDCV
jgi:hypothetical protein